MASSNQVKFNSPEFSKIFTRIAEKNSKDGLHCIRHINKFHSAEFEEGMDSAKVDFQNLQALTTSKFADRVRYLTVRIPGDLKYLNELCYASTAFLPNVKKVNVVFTEGQSAKEKRIILYQALVFRGLNIVREYPGGHIEIWCNHDVQIIDSNFDGIGLFLRQFNKLTVQNSCFLRSCGLQCSLIKNTTTIDNVKFFNCETGLDIVHCGDVSVNKIYAEKCQIGCNFYQVTGELKIKNVEILDCEHGMQFTMTNNSTVQNSNIVGTLKSGIFFHTATNSIVQNCNIVGALETGIFLMDANVRYRRIFIDQSDSVDKEFQKVCWVDSTFTEIS